MVPIFLRARIDNLLGGQFLAMGKSNLLGGQSHLLGRATAHPVYLLFTSLVPGAKVLNLPPPVPSRGSYTAAGCLYGQAVKIKVLGFLYQRFRLCTSNKDVVAEQAVKCHVNAILLMQTIDGHEC